ncbi:hypothetical protein Pla22_40810 [Rubripirellula amarantea]|uniref:DUF4365 domain-containing protein n=1 Tax=Rubripirellula amarantea TaxID=2527999 RepID=A0A5C5WKK6_9BACT|nr:hypothetical protein [Rubripirellula amarantea]TWT51304.1 hypothetical protein Pla22_40810 [Rubripirellula amarantea]
MLRTSYAHLNTIQKGCFAEAYSKMAFTLEGFEVYDSEYDDRGIDFVCRSPGGVFYSVQVKATDTTSNQTNPFIFESKFQKTSDFLMCAVRLAEGFRPSIYLARGSDWGGTSECLGFNANGGNSGAYYEMRFAKRYADSIELHTFADYIHRLRAV